MRVGEFRVEVAGDFSSETASKVLVNGTSSFQSETVSLRRHDGERTVSVGGTFERAEHPSAMALFAREIAYLALE